MAIVVGDLLSDTDVQSFISVADADAYLAPEARAAWEGATAAQKEAALVVASRWLAFTFVWDVTELDADELVQVGRVAARVAVEALSRDLMAPYDPATAVKSERVGPISIVYRDIRSASLVWPWLVPMLTGLVAPAGAAVRVLRA